MSRALAVYMVRSLEALVILSPERWEATSATQRSLPNECARQYRVVVVEPPVFDATEPELELRRDDVIVAVPHFEPETPDDVIEIALRRMLDRVFAELGTCTPILWYRTADALGFTHHVEARAIVYEPSPSAPATSRDTLLRQHADVVIGQGHAVARLQLAA
jgi:hypothetical protein